MRHSVLLLFAAVVLHFSAFSQDTLVKRSGEEIVVKVLKITPSEVEYQRFDNLEGPLIVELKSEVAAIRYANGTREVFEEITTLPGTTSPYYVAPITTSRLTSQELYLKGRQDALLYYKGRGAFWGTFGPSAYFPPAGLVAGLIIGSKSPKVTHLVVSEEEFRLEPNYLRGYKDQAHRRKIGKAAAGFGAGVGVFAVIFLVLSGLNGL